MRMRQAWHVAPSVADALAELAMRNQTLGRKVMPLLVLATGLALLTWQEPSAVALWVAIYGVLALVDAYFHHVVVPRLRQRNDQARIMAGTMITAFVMMGAWAAPGLWAWVEGVPANNALLVMLLCVSLAVIATAQGPCLRIYAASTAPVALVLVSIPAFFSMMVGPALVVLIVIDILFMVALAWQTRQNAIHMICLREQNSALVARLGDAVAEAEQARERAEAASRAKSTFLAGMSHEIRTPLNAILGFSEVIRDQVFGPVGNERYSRYAADIHQSGSHLLGLINDILDLSRIEAGKTVIKPTRIDLDEAFSAVSGLLELKASEAMVSLEHRTFLDMPYLWADERSLRQILINLVSNALRFTPPGGAIFMTAQLASDGGVIVEVSDTGIGIPPDDLGRVTEAYVQARQEARTRHQGTGLGLSIVKSMMELHGGRFTIDSKLGEGTRAKVFFPPERSIPSVQLEKALAS